MILAPNEVLGDGRYLLLAPCGADERAGMEFWHARDVAHDTDVALTVLLGDPADQAAVSAARHVLEGVRYAETAEHPALAKVLDIPGPGRVAAWQDGVLGLVVAEWTHGVDLADGIRGAQLPVATACRLLRPLVEAVDVAHHAGVVAGVDSPGRVRIDEQGAAVLAFRGTPPASSTREDVRGLGAVLYLLLTGDWPADQFAAPADLRAEVPRDLSLIAVLSLDGTGTQGPDIRTCGPLLRALDDTIAYQGASAYEPLPPPAPAPAATDPVPAPPPRPSRMVAWRSVARSALRGRRLAAVGVTLVVALAVLIGTRVVGSYGVDSANARPAALVPPVAAAPTTTSSAPPVTTTTTKPPPPPPVPVTPDSVREYVVSGSEDNPATLSRVIDGAAGTTWKTDEYRQQFPSFAPGIGILARLPRSLALASVTISSPSAGTVVEIHTAAGPGTPLSSAPLLATATLRAGATTIRLPARPPTGYLLVWITRLDDTGGGFQSLIGEISAQPSA